LVAVEGQRTPGALHDDGGRQSTKHTGLVVLGRIEGGHNRIIRVRQLRLTCWTNSSIAVGVGEAERLRAGNTEDVAAGRDNGSVLELRATLEGVASQRVVHGVGVLVPRVVVLMLV